MMESHNCSSKEIFPPLPLPHFSDKQLRLRKIKKLAHVRQSTRKQEVEDTKKGGK
jgi:hypothetical protein